jgi:hypothetical protein
MSVLRSVCLLAIGALLAACGGGAATSPTAAPTIAPTAAPTSAPTAAPSLDPSQGDAGVVGRATVSGDERADRDGTYDIVGVAADGSACGTSFEGDEFVAAALDESAADGEVRQMFVAVRSAELPTADGQTIDAIEDGRAGFDFKSESGVGTLYVGEPLDDERTTVSIDVTQSGSDLIFDFDATTWDGVAISGQMICADAV